MLTLEETKIYLRVDDENENRLIENLIQSAYDLCVDVARIEKKDEEELKNYPYFKLAILYAIAYLYEHREEADHNELNKTLRALLFGIRKESF